MSNHRVSEPLPKLKNQFASQLGGILANEKSLRSVWERWISFTRRIPNFEVYSQEGAFFLVIAVCSLLLYKALAIKFLFVIPIFRLTRRLGFTPGALASVLAAIDCTMVDFRIEGMTAIYFGLILNTLALLSVALMAHNLNDKLNQVQNQAETDALTGALNRFGFNRTFEEATSEREQTHDLLTLAVIDLDDFKMLNDVYGHGFGDNILKALKACLDPAVAEGGCVARLGGDEFVVMFEGLDLAEARTRIQRARIRFKKSSIILGQQATFSFGIALASPECKDPEKLIHAADLDMYSSKAASKAVTVPWMSVVDGKGA